MEWNKKKTVIQSSNIDLEGRWIVRGDDFFQKDDVLKVFTRFIQNRSGDRALSRTVNTLCEDYYMNRSVILRTLNYTPHELRDGELIQQKRRVLAEQIELLNKIHSNMLPEPLDYFFVENNCDDFQVETKEIKETEPVLVLDFIPGEILSDVLKSTNSWKFYRRREENQPFTKRDEDLNVQMVLRLAGDILLFMREMYEKGYAYTSLSTDHIILLGDAKPRFVGIGRICPIHNDRFDCNHINYGRQLKGYSPPEMNRANDLFGLNSSVKANLAFNLGALISRLVLSSAQFDDRFITDGSYDYEKAIEDRNRIKNISPKLDSLLFKILKLDAQTRLTDLDEIQTELMYLSGDAIREKKVKIDEKMQSGMVTSILLDRGFGFIRDDEGYDVFIPPFLKDDLFTLYVGERVYYHTKVSPDGRISAKRFVEAPRIPRTDIVYPRFVPKPDPVVVKPQPKPQPQPTPDYPKNMDVELKKTTEEAQKNQKKNNTVTVVICLILAGILLYLACKNMISNQSEPKKVEESTTESGQDMEEEDTEEKEEETASKVYIRIIVKDGNVRSGPGTDYNVVGLVHEDEIYEYTGNTDTPENKPWYEIYLDDENNTTGWISSIVGEIDEGYDPNSGD